ncbi:LacI family DNA-binding transcriptional regulator [Bifidobacterium sp. 82T24]|uniref:LacI family DNA-binding transcriptional regulator n=1 Tax=Bifidobacterium pluvialisilvae TaxID=2834436 RepID=UPI001C5895CB|nr:LacI family DNA-binding transcriptional regulator [Bifidobacterium pluvialisilvae]MBW3087197.1 LacI family DNA-binding transcriptional regulator [Bifidobacterium pluvialisilvae]
MTKPTLREIAEAAHVSIATASKALRDDSGPSARTKLEVRRIARRLGYETGSAREDRRTWRSGLIGLVSSDVLGRPSMPLLIGAEQTLGPVKHAVLMANSYSDTALERTRIEQVIARGVDGLMVAGPSADARHPLPKSLVGDTPVVYVVGASSDPRDCSVVADFAQGAYEAVSHLVTIGRRRIAVIGGYEYALASRERIRGIDQAMAEHGLCPIAPIRYQDWSSAWGRRAAGLLLDDGVPFDGLFCFNDRIARGAEEVLIRHGVRIPDDVALIGFDNWDDYLLDTEVPITSVDNGTQKIGRISAQYLLDAIKGNPHTGVTKVPCTLVRRESTLGTR